MKWKTLYYIAKGPSALQKKHFMKADRGNTPGYLYESAHLEITRRNISQPIYYFQ